MHFDQSATTSERHNDKYMTNINMSCNITDNIVVTIKYVRNNNDNNTSSRGVYIYTELCQVKFRLDF